MSNENLKAFAVELGLNAEDFNQCLDSGKYTEQVNQQTAVARQIGVQSTPAFLINTQAILGAQPFENFKVIIDQFLQ